MDPKTTLEEIRALVARVNTEGEDSPDIDILLSLCELWEALDGWMTRGGFSPWPTLSEIIHS